MGLPKELIEQIFKCHKDGMPIGMIARKFHIPEYIVVKLVHPHY